MRHTYIGHLGAAVEPVMRPLGFDWRMSVSLITGFVAKEIVVSTLGVLYEAGEGASETLQQSLKASGLTAAAALAFMVFVLLYTPCLATVVTLWRESGAIKWMLFSVSLSVNSGLERRLGGVPPQPIIRVGLKKSIFFWFTFMPKKDWGPLLAPNLFNN